MTNVVVIRNRSVENVRRHESFGRAKEFHKWVCNQFSKDLRKLRKK
jgi:hypothetical protein